MQKKGIAVAGNISPSMLDVLQAHLQADDLPAAWVLELSSFQLHGMDTFAADAPADMELFGGIRNINLSGPSGETIELSQNR